MKRHTRHAILTIATLLTLLTLQACKRNCTCYTFTGETHTFTEAELDNEGKTCSDMQRTGLGLIYAHCENSN